MYFYINKNFGDFIQELTEKSALMSKFRIFMDWFNYIPLLIIFVAILSSITKKKQVETTKTNLPDNKNEKEMYFPDISTEKLTISKPQKKENIIQAKITKTIEPKTFPTNDTLCIETDRLDANFFSVVEIDEIRRAIVYTEIFNKKFYNN